MFDLSEYEKTSDIALNRMGGKRYSSGANASKTLPAIPPLRA
jgi:hypothetical protein